MQFSSSMHVTRMWASDDVQNHVLVFAHGLILAHGKYPIIANVTMHDVMRDDDDSRSHSIHKFSSKNYHGLRMWTSKFACFPTVYTCHCIIRYERPIQDNASFGQASLSENWIGPYILAIIWLQNWSELKSVFFCETPPHWRLHIHSHKFTLLNR